MSAKAHMSLVAALPCALCEGYPVELHHILEGRTPGRKSPDWLVIPLCPDCHRGDDNGIHGRQAMLKIKKTSELQLLAKTYETLYGT